MSKIFVPPGYSVMVRLLDFDESANVQVKAWTEIEGEFQPAQAGLVAAGQEPRDVDIILPVGRTMLHFISVETDAASDSGDNNFCQIGLVQNSSPNNEFDIILTAGRLIPEKLISWPDSWNCPCGDVSLNGSAIIGVPTLGLFTLANPLSTWSPPAGKLARLQYCRISFITGATGGNRDVLFSIGETGNNQFFIVNDDFMAPSDTFQLQASTQSYLEGEEHDEILFYKMLDIMIDDTMELVWTNNSAIGADAFADDGEVYYLSYDA